MAAPRLCPHCGTPTRGRCARCRNERYGTHHQAERRHWAPTVNTGTQPCARGTWCGEPHLIDPTQPWHLDHIDGQRLPSCARHNDQYAGQ